MATEINVDDNRRMLIQNLRENPKGFIFHTGELVSWRDHKKRCSLGLAADLFDLNVFTEGTYTKLSELLGYDADDIYDINDKLYNEDVNGFKTVADKLEQLWFPS